MNTTEFIPRARFASIEESLAENFVSISRDIDELVVKFDLPDHTELNSQRFPWATGLLSKPAFYASRLWEYPYAILAAELQEKMYVADVGCGMTGFTPYLKSHRGCNVTGVDPDIFDRGVKYGGHGVSREFIDAVGLKVESGFMDQLPLEDNSMDRVFCISVMEHVPHEVARRGVQEMARVLKPGGRAILTMDVNMWSIINRPLDLVWDSGLTLPWGIDLRWPNRRFGIFCDGKQPADVIGITLLKEECSVDTAYKTDGESTLTVPHHIVPTLRHSDDSQPDIAPEESLLAKVRRRLVR